MYQPIAVGRLLAGGMLGILTAAGALATPVTLDLTGFELSLDNADVGPTGFVKAATAGTSWNVSKSVGGFELGTGLKLTGRASGNLGISTGLTLGDMITSLDWSGRTRIAIDDRGTEVLIGSRVLRDSSALATTSPVFNARIGLDLASSLGFSAKGCIVGECTSSGKSYAFDFHPTLLEAGTDGSSPLRFLDQGLVANFGKPNVIVAGDCPAGMKGCAVGVPIGSVTVYDPDLSLHATGGSGHTLDLTASTTGRLVDTSANLTAFLGLLAGAPPPDVGFRAGPLNGDLSLFRVSEVLSLSLTERQTLRIVPTQTFTFDAPTDVLFKVITATFDASRSLGPFTCGRLREIQPSLPASISNSSATGRPSLTLPPGIAGACYQLAEHTEYRAVSSLTLDEDDLFTVRPDQPIGFTVDVALASSLQTTLQLDLDGNTSIDLLKASVGFKDFDKKLGPVLSKDFGDFGEPFTVYKRTDLLGTLQCSQHLTFDGAIVADDANCLDHVPIGSIVAPPRDNLGALPPLPPLDNSGGSFEEVAEPGTLALLLPMVLIAVRRRRTTSLR